MLYAVSVGETNNPAKVTSPFEDIVVIDLIWSFPAPPIRATQFTDPVELYCATNTSILPVSPTRVVANGVPSALNAVRIVVKKYPKIFMFPLESVNTFLPPFPYVS